MRYSLRLYVSGSSASSVRAIANLRGICERALAGDYEVDVIDVLEHPSVAEAERIMATPMLVRRLPEPVRRIIGDLSDRERVMIGLELAEMSTRSVEREAER